MMIYIYFIIVAIVLIAIYVAYRVIKCSKNKKSTTEPLLSEVKTDASEISEQEMTEFESACEFVQKVNGDLSNVILLNLYALYKQSVVGDCDTSRPASFDMVKAAKWDAWNKLKGMSSNEAQLKYIDYVSKLYPDWKIKTDFTPQKSSERSDDDNWGKPVGGITIGDSDAYKPQDNIWYYASEGSYEKVYTLIQNNVDLNLKDETGKTALHWACDRGHEDIVDLLLEHPIDVNIKDNDGCTALSLALTCEYNEIAEKLVEHGASIDDCDNDQSTLEYCEPEFIEHLRSIQKI
ncbi:hypothetical protein WA158_007907 [Blastocystis sp. Blastoise]